MQLMTCEISTLIPSLKRYPTVDLGLQTTPIEALTRMGDKLGISLFAKRDDATTISMGGNKVRQLEYYLGAAIHADADTILITGAVQSNFTRLCTAAAKKLGLHAVVQLENRVPKEDISYNQSGNVLLNQLLGAEIHYFPIGENESAADANLDRMAEQLLINGRKPYVIHLGIEHPPLGGLGYAYCAAECFQQLQAMQQLPDHIVIPSGSGLTHAGFLGGARSFGWEVPIHGICVRRSANLQYDRIMQRTNEINQLLGGDGDTDTKDVLVDDAVLEPGYGQLNAQVMKAMSDSAQLEALLLDPVYSGRTMAGLISLVHSGKIQAGETVLFIHTGGLASLFAYQTELTNGLRAFQNGINAQQDIDY